MITAVDSNPLFDVLLSTPELALQSQRAIVRAASQGSLAICPVVYSELLANFGQAEDMQRFLRDMQIGVDAFSTRALEGASAAWQGYLRRRRGRLQCPRCGSRFSFNCPSCNTPIAWRQHLLTDFLIGGHALADADALLTRDTGYFRTYFPQLTLIVPGATL